MIARTVADVADVAYGDLVAAAVAGDEVAFTRIVELHHLDMRRACFMVCGDIHVAEDAVAAGWALAWRRLGSLRDPDRLRPWLISIAVNEARQLVRSRRRHPVVELSVTDELASSSDGGAIAADVDLRNALARLSPDDRALLTLRYVAGFDSFELAEATGRSASGTRARLARLIARLRSELSDD